MRRSIAVALVLSFASPAAAAPSKELTIAGKVGRSNVQVSIIIHPQAPNCAAGLVKELRKQALELGRAHVRANLAKLVKQAGTDASGDKQFFGVAFLAGCPGEGVGWIAFPAHSKEKDKTLWRYAPGVGWSAPMRM